MTKTKETMEIKEQIAVMQAFADGKEIEVRPLYSTENDWVKALTPVWNWDSFEYRIKPESNPRPYTFEELANALIEKGGYVRKKDSGSILHVNGISRDGVNVGISAIFYNEKGMLDTFTWLDGSPCGVIEEE